MFRPASDGNTVELLARGEEAFGRFYQIIEQATSTIHITTYILGRGDVGDALTALLARKAASGVSVRLMLDSVGSWRIGKHYLAPLRKAGAHVAYFMPVLAHPIQGAGQPANHRKIVVVDSRIALTGGMNLARPYMGPTRRRQLLALTSRSWSRVRPWPIWNHCSSPTGPLPRAIQLTAPAKAPESGGDTAHGAPRPCPPSGGSMVQVVASGPDVPDDPLYEIAGFARSSRPGSESGS